MAQEQMTRLGSKRLQLTRVVDPLGSQDAKKTFISAVCRGLLSNPKTLPFSFFYDEVGSALFEKICKLPEYYLTRTEDSILRSEAVKMVSGWPVGQPPPTIVELGSGSAEKTRRLIEAGIKRFQSLRYVPIDVSATAVEESSMELLRVFPTLRINAFVGDYQDCLADIGKRFEGPKWILFLGSSLGNYDLESAENLLRRLAFVMHPSDRLLLGTDLAKNSLILEAAYDDPQGITARFNKNLLARINRELQGDFVLGQFHHRAIYNSAAERVEMHLISRVNQVVTIPRANLEVAFLEGESIHTENSHKYTVEGLHRLAAATGFKEEEAWTDPKEWFRVQSWRPSRRN